MKNKNQKTKGLRISSETIRKLDMEQLTNIVGGFTGTQSNNGCGSRGGGTTACQACQV
ncbi:MAG: class I lanthipeptide [Kofleriaceae bacterium]